MGLVVETPIDARATKVLGDNIEKRLMASKKFDLQTTPFKYLTLKSDKDQCFGVEVSTIAKPPRKGSHFYSIMFILPQSIRDAHEKLLGPGTYEQHFLLHNGISSLMSKYSVVKAVWVKQGEVASTEQSKKVTMEIRVACTMFKSNYPTLLKDINAMITRYAKQIG